MERPKRPYSIHSRPTTKRSRRIYYACFRNEAGDYTSAISTGCTRKDDAIRWAEHHLEISRTHRESMTLAQYAEGFWKLEGAYAQGKLARGFALSHGYLEVAEANTRNHLVPAWGECQLRELTVPKVDAWVLALRKHGQLAAGTINKLLQTLRTILDAAVADGLIQENPAQYVKPVRLVQTERGTLTAEEITRLLSTTSWRDFRHYAINLLALATGARLGEIQGLQVQDVHADCIEIRHSWEQGHGLKEPKWGSARAVPISPRVFDVLDQVIHETCPQTIVFYGQSPDVPIARSWIERSLYDALSRIGIDEVTRRARHLTFHSHRHTLNTILRSRGIADSKVRAITGHRSEAMSNRYTHFRAADFYEVVVLQEALLPPAGGQESS